MKKYTKIVLVLAYDGSDTFGWQKQKNKPTIQGLLEQSLQSLFKQPIKTQGSGRTDAKVHALHQVAHFTLPQTFALNLSENLAQNTKTLSHILRATQKKLPDFIQIKKAFVTLNSFHALHSAQKKTYKYIISSSTSPFKKKYAYCIQKKQFETLKQKILELNALSQALIGQHDFKSFQSSGTPTATTTRTISEALWKETSSSLQLTIIGNGFLKQMVRNIIGAQIHLVLKNTQSEQQSKKTNQKPSSLVLTQWKKIISQKNRQKAFKPAPPQGLYLAHVQYPKIHKIPLFI